MSSSDRATTQSPPRISENALVISTWALCGAAACLIAARLVTRWQFSRRWFADDAFAVAALAILIGNSVTTQIMAGPMYEILNVSNGRLEPNEGFADRASVYLKCQFASTMLFWSCLWAVKACFLAFFYRLTDQLKWPRRFWWAIAAFTVLSYVGATITYPVSCTSFVLGECQTPLNVERSLVSLRYSTAVDIITDVMIICLPIYLTFNLKMTWAQKLSLAAVLCLGVIITIFSVIRIILTNSTGRQPEISWLALWSSIESSIAVMVACLASFKVLLANKRRGTRTPYAGLSGENSARKYGANTRLSKHEGGLADVNRAGTMVSANGQEMELRSMERHSGKEWGDITVTRTVTVSGGGEQPLNFGFSNRREPWSGDARNEQLWRKRDQDEDNESQEQILR